MIGIKNTHFLLSCHLGHTFSHQGFDRRTRQKAGNEKVSNNDDNKNNGVVG